MIGEGILKIPAYKCNLPFDRLEQLRKDFWATKKNNPIWLVLKSCCETDACNFNK